ncbi:MAG: hypothetical protein AAFX52_05950 [Pseudomonadota bacterium]
MSAWENLPVDLIAGQNFGVQSHCLGRMTASPVFFDVTKDKTGWPVSVADLEAQAIEPSTQGLEIKEYAY